MSNQMNLAARTGSVCIYRRERSISSLRLAVNRCTPIWGTRATSHFISQYTMSGQPARLFNRNASLAILKEGMDRSLPDSAIKVPSSWPLTQELRRAGCLEIRFEPGASPALIKKVMDIVTSRGLEATRLELRKLGVTLEIVEPKS